MGLPSKLKNMNLFHDGVSFLGLVPEVSLPKLGRKMEGYRGGGMDGEVDVDMGQEKLEMEWTAGGLIVEILRQFGEVTHDATQMRFAGAYQAEDTGLVVPVEVVVRGRHQELDMGNAKPGSDTEHKVKSSLSYYKLIVNGRTEIEIDLMGMKFIVNGNDRLAAQRAAIGI